MPISLTKIANNSAHISFKFGEDEINLEYYPGRITEKLFAQMASFAQMDEKSIENDVNGTFEKFTSFNATLCNIVKSWDVYEDEDQTVLFPLIPERVQELPFIFRTACIDAIVGDMRPKNEMPAQS